MVFGGAINVRSNRGGDRWRDRRGVTMIFYNKDVSQEFEAVSRKNTLSTGKAYLKQKLSKK